MGSNFWNLRINERLFEWKDFRHNIDSLPLERALVEVNNLWSSAPFVTYYLNSDAPETWPDPWTLLAENYYCDLAKALGILYTIYFTSHKSNNMSLCVYYNYKDKVRSNLVSIDHGKYILNYWPCEIVNTKQIENEQMKLLYSYTAKDLHLEKY